MAVAGEGVEVGFYQPLNDGNGRVELVHLENFDIGSIDSRVKLVHLFLNYAFYLIGQEHTFGVRCSLTEGFIEREGGHLGPRKLYLSGCNVVKIYKQISEEDSDSLVEFYQVTKSIPGIEKCLNPTQKHGSLVCKLTPIGLPLTFEQNQASLIHWIKIIYGLHRLGWAHLDIRQPNMVHDPLYDSYTLIDSECARKFGSPFPEMINAFKGTKFLLGKVCPQADFHLLAKWIESHDMSKFEKTARDVFLSGDLTQLDTFLGPLIDDYQPYATFFQEESD